MGEMIESLDPGRDVIADGSMKGGEDRPVSAMDDVLYVSKESEECQFMI